MSDLSSLNSCDLQSTRNYALLSTTHSDQVDADSSHGGLEGFPKGVALWLPRTPRIWVLCDVFDAFAARLWESTGEDNVERELLKP